MKKLIILSLVAIFAMASFNSCKKYDDGPALSFRSKTNRLVGNWKLSKAVDQSGVDVSNLYKNYTISFADDNTFTTKYNNVNGSGTWAFDDKKENVILTYSGASNTFSFLIIRLTNDEFTFDYTVNSSTTRFYYIAN